MPHITEASKSVEHSWEVKRKYAQSAKAHHQAMDQTRHDAVTTLLIMTIVALALVAIIVYALFTTPVI